MRVQQGRLCECFAVGEEVNRVGKLSIICLVISDIYIYIYHIIA